MTNNANIEKRKVIAKYEVLLGFVFLACGCTIYLLFRNKSLYIYQWCISLGLSDIIDSLRYAVQDWKISEWIRYSLPDGLYCAAYLLIMDAIWHNEDRLIKSFIVSLIPLVTISSELLQYVGLVKGTFDLNDLICYIIPPMIYLLINKHNSSKFNILKIQLL